MLEIVGLKKQFVSKKDVVNAIDDVTLSVGDGELLVLLGPSGSGKTTVLRCIAGHETADAGSITVGSKTVFDASSGIVVPPDRRRIGMVFQNYALWPHMTVQKNIEFPLRAQRLKGRPEFESAVSDVVKIVGCEHLVDRYPGELSGGQQQRVALARGMVARPTFMLFDEPLSNLDALLRAQVRQDLHHLHRQLRFSGVYVTHDQTEAFAIGDRIAIMQAGSIEQIGTPREIYNEPTTEFAANFVGLSNSLRFLAGGGGWKLDGSSNEPTSLPLSSDTGDVAARFRPSDVQLIQHLDSQEAGLRLRATVVDGTYEGRHYVLAIEIHGTSLLATVPAADSLDDRIQPGATITVGVPWDRCLWFVDGRRIPVDKMSRMMADI